MGFLFEYPLILCILLYKRFFLSVFPSSKHTHRTHFYPIPVSLEHTVFGEFLTRVNHFITREKNRAQDCLTVSNFKLDNVFSNVFGKAASAITKRILEKPTERITNVSGFRTKCLKATDEKRRTGPLPTVSFSVAEAVYILQRQGYLVTAPATT